MARDGDLASLADDHSLFAGSAREKLELLREELVPLAEQYDVVVANPPYMGSSSLGRWMSAWVKKRYPHEKSDLCTSFIERGFVLCRRDGTNAMITMQSWMFLGSYERMRDKLLRNHSILSMAHLGTRAFGAIAGEVVSTTATVFGNITSDAPGAYFRLVDMGGEDEKREGYLEALANPQCGWFYRRDASAFGAIPGSPVAYWANNSMFKAFSRGNSLRRYAYGCNGITTGENARFLRQWFEVSATFIDFRLNAHDSLNAINAWVPYNKGGEYRKWASHLDFVINWKNGGAEIKDFGHLVMRSKGYMLLPGFTWPKISSGHIAMRRMPEGFMFDVAGLSLFPNDPDHGLVFEAFVNSSIASEFLAFLSPTLNFEVGNVTAIPILGAMFHNSEIHRLSENCNALAEESRDSSESSWDFKRHPLV